MLTKKTQICTKNLKIPKIYSESDLKLTFCGSGGHSVCGGSVNVSSGFWAIDFIENQAGNRDLITKNTYFLFFNFALWKKFQNFYTVDAKSSKCTFMSHQTPVQISFPGSFASQLASKFLAESQGKNGNPHKSARHFFISI